MEKSYIACRKIHACDVGEFLWCGLLAPSRASRPGRVEGMAETFRDREVARIKESGWLANLRLREVLEGAGLPSPLDFLVETFSWGFKKNCK